MCDFLFFKFVLDISLTFGNFFHQSITFRVLCSHQFFPETFCVILYFCVLLLHSYKRKSFIFNRLQFLCFILARKTSSSIGRNFCVSSWHDACRAAKILIAASYSSVRYMRACCGWCIIGHSRVCIGTVLCSCRKHSS